MRLERDPLPTQASVRQLELETGRLVLRAAADGDAFLVRRAHAAVASLERSAAKRALRRAVNGLAEHDLSTLQTGLLAYGAVLERHGVHDAAAEVYASVRSRCDDGCVVLHQARASRKAGLREEAASLYRLVREQSADAHTSLMAATGEALLAADPVAALTEVARAARAHGAWEVYAVAREERARLTSSVRDLVAAAGRYTDGQDRVRVLHRLADMLASRGDLSGAREALLAALDVASEAQRPHTVQRMRILARGMGDELTLRRTRGAASAALVTLMPTRARSASRSIAASLWRWRRLMGARA